MGKASKRTAKPKKQEKYIDIRWVELPDKTINFNLYKRGKLEATILSCGPHDSRQVAANRIRTCLAEAIVYGYDEAVKQYNAIAKGGDAKMQEEYQNPEETQDLPESEDVPQTPEDQELSQDNTDVDESSDSLLDEEVDENGIEE